VRPSSGRARGVPHESEPEEAPPLTGVAISAWAMDPGRRRRYLQIAFGLAALGVAIGVLYLLRDFLGAFVLGAAIAFLIQPWIAQLVELGLPRAVATSSSHAAVEHQLGRSGILERFQAIVAAGDYARGKPNPDPFLTAAGRLGVDPALCLALEDSHNGVRAAHAAGMMTIMVPDLLAATDEMRERCIMIAESLHDVRHVLTKPARRASAG